ncbi:molybdopterin cofactor-binding domain-containing protein [Novosphingobium sp.]|uniref:molybdopterin cofactor-binding domain-containing protein n=1 Tax=Novosphingobium sp. TaxID=1874826 RepID=UPI0038B729BE
MERTRRSVLVGTGAAGALVAAFALWPHRYAAPLQAGSDELVVDGFVRIAADGAVSVAVPVCEMGQGITTLCAQIVAVELGADRTRIGVESAPPGPFYADAVLAAHWAPLWLPYGLDSLAGGLAADPTGTLAQRTAERTPFTMTADGTALAAFEAPLRAAAAALRAQLTQAAAARWGVGWETCEARDHRISHGTQSATFAELLPEARAITPPDPPVLRAEPAREGGAALAPGALPRFARLDLPAKVDGSFVFAGDVRLPGMLHAAIAQPPQGDAVLASFDRAAAASVPGVVEVVNAERWLAALGTTWYAADKALTAMDPRFRAKGRVVDSGAMEAALDRALRRGDATTVAAVGDPAALLQKPSLSARYDIEPALCGPLETATATARLTHGRLELWLATQAPDQAAMAAARALGLSRGDVVIYPLHAGGSFDARLDVRVAEQAAILAKAVKRPVQLMWSRWQETLAGFPRAPVAAQMAAAFGPERRLLLGWRARLAQPASAIEAAARLLDGKSAPAALATARGRVDAMACEGALPFYAIPERAVEHVPVDLSLPSGRQRGNAHAVGAYLTECFIDECAQFAGVEPLAFRIGLLSGQPRLAACLQGVARLAEWGGGRDASGQGIACHRMDLRTAQGLRSGFVAVVATARQEADAVRVERLSAYCDIGRIINADIARQQVEGALVAGLALAVGGTTQWQRGVPQAGRLAALGLPLLADCPKVDVAFADSSEHPFDPGELGMVAAAPAIANALFSATGVRFRRLPLLSEGL